MPKRTNGQRGKLRFPRWVDLSLPIHDGMPTFPSHWHPLVEVTQLGRHGIEDRETRRIVMGTHSGTHMDAPRHMVPGGRTIDTAPLDLMTGRAGLVDFMPAAPRKEYGLVDFKAALKGRRVLPRMLIRYGWSKRWGRMSYFTDAPYPSVEACHWLGRQGVRLLGMDTANVDCHAHGWKTPQDSRNHKALFQHGIFLVEYMNNLDRLRASEFEFVVMPLNILRADGAPARCLAIEGRP
ncbi:MAG: cyclase family protein [Elusimicrobia bacterium]|nr:cyclase family protein [Elusimicrobiota bacterium]